MVGKPICPEFRVCMCILQYNDAGESIHYRKLADIFEDGPGVSRAVDRLSDLCMVYGTWEKDPGFGWVYGLHVDEEFEGFVRGLHNTSE